MLQSVWVKQAIAKMWPAVLYSVLGLLVLGPLLRPGYILTLDLVFVPHLRLPTDVTNSFVFSALLHYLNLVLPSQIIEKLILFSTLVACGLGGYRLFNQAAPGPSTPLNWGALFAGTLYMINPFTYARFMSGQYLVVAGYALLPYFALGMQRLLASFAQIALNPAVTLATASGHKFSLAGIWRHSLSLAACIIAISILSIHTIGFMLLLALLVLVFNLRLLLSHWRIAAAGGGMLLAIVLLGSSYWLLPLWRGQGSTAQEIRSFNSANSQVYRTDGGQLGLPLNVLGLSGFWSDAQSRYELPWELVPLWSVFVLILVLMVLFGLIRSARQGDRLGLALAAAGILAAILALGDAWAPLAPLNHFLVNNVPLYKGYREPQKFVALVVLAYSYLGGKTLQALGGKSVSQSAKMPAIALYHLALPNWKVIAARLLRPAGLFIGMALPLLLTPSMLWAFNTQLRSADYPADWYRVNRILLQSSSESTKQTKITTLFLPWHQYMYFDFAQRTIATPASAFFDTPVMAGDNAEFPRRAPASPNSQFVLGTLDPAGAAGRDIAPILASRGIGYVAIAQTADSDQYKWLSRQPRLMLVYQGRDLILYRLVRNG